MPMPDSSMNLSYNSSEGGPIFQSTPYLFLNHNASATSTGTYRLPVYRLSKLRPNDFPILPAISRGKSPNLMPLSRRSSGRRPTIPSSRRHLTISQYLVSFQKS